MQDTVIVERKRRRLGLGAGLAPPAKPVPPAQRPMSRPEIAHAISDIKAKARLLRPPMGNNPNAFHEDKSELVRAIERLEDAIRLGRPLKTEEPEND